MADLISADVRELLAAILDALTVPNPASYEHREACDRVLISRALLLTGIIGAALNDETDVLSVQQYAALVRRVVAEHAPVTYPTKAGGAQ